MSFGVRKTEQVFILNRNLDGKCAGDPVWPKVWVPKNYLKQRVKTYNIAEIANNMDWMTENFDLVILYETIFSKTVL